MQKVRPFKSDLGVLKVDADDAQDHRACSRLKNINLTKLHSSYKLYVKTVPRELRLKCLEDSWHPVTPDHCSKASISQWNREISAWRKKVYLWNNVLDTQSNLLSEAVRKGDVEGFLNICTRDVCRVPIDNGYSRLLDPTRTDEVVTPIIYKPRWFKGQITHSGIQILEEKEFLDRAAVVYGNSDDRFKTFYAEYLRSYTDAAPFFDG
ncbi:hypothetical protein X943_000461 [Babesia divergens]|uniref:Histone RNA hairpin-binding protein RNA-binding domain-containing protein n=1 Tax=Babesia divergens TaxID=32595 RepID=A0AAD9LK44_BABDI|nr:hypothetical protein X943_000461 [Babesia divergens]